MIRLAVGDDDSARLPMKSHQENGHPIRPLLVVHTETYVDYSHGVRLMSRHVMVDASATRVDDLLKNPNHAPLLGDEGVIEAR
jgi:hypothetical protein